MSAAQRWQVVLTEQAEADFRVIVQWTSEAFGRRQALSYGSTLRAALRELRDSPKNPRVRRGEGLQPDVRLLHIGRRGRPGRHFIVFQEHANEHLVLVLRILHDAMDLKRHVPGGGSPDEG